MSITALTILNIVFFLAVLVVNYLGSSGFFNNMGQAEVSAKYQTKVTPNGFAFSIWGVIYTLLLITLVYYFFQRNDPAVHELIRLTSGLFILSSLFNMGWIVAFSYEKLGISTVFIFGLLFSLMIIIERIYIHRADFPSTLAGTAFTLYASWVLIATILNIALLLVQKQWQGFGRSESVWTITILFVTIAFVVFYITLYQNAVFPIALAWAFYGIYSSYTEGKIQAEMSVSIQKVLIFGIAFFALLTIFLFVRNGWLYFLALSEEF